MKLLLKFSVVIFFVSLLHSIAFSQILKVDAIGITVKDLNRSVKFYTEVLGFKKISETELAGEEYEKLFNVLDCIFAKRDCN
ncbi:MAG: VOC family protein [Chitinophagaceae bacterium]